MTENTNTTKKALSHALQTPRITEKASFLSGGNVYTFNVPKDFNKAEIAKAVEQIYKVKPLKVRVITIPSKTVTFKNRPGVKGGGKKAMVQLKAGDKIEFV